MQVSPPKGGDQSLREGGTLPWSFPEVLLATAREQELKCLLNLRSMTARFDISYSTDERVVTVWPRGHGSGGAAVFGQDPECVATVVAVHSPPTQS